MVDEGVSEGSEHAAENLHRHVGNCLGRCNAVRNHDGQRNSWVEVSAGDVAQGVDHAHQRGRYREGTGLGVAKFVQADGQHQHEGAQELAHQCRPVQLRTAEVLRPHHREEHRRKGRSCQLEANVGQAQAKARTGDVDAKSHGRVEAAARHGAGPIGAGNDHKADCKAVVLVALHLLRNCYVQHHEAKHEGVEELAQTSFQQVVASGGCQGEAVLEEHRVADCGCHACRKLHGRVEADCLEVQARSAQNFGDSQSRGHRRVEVGP
mmetsp:Transcript_37105/g.59757  ORF Transcript_37105/g.59757 Transcript_37105/m.59757 type:complete len:265 (+) Transcript_37105:456-1250(+)